MNHNDPRLTQHVLGEENSAEMTEALNSDPALRQEAEALQATADRMRSAVACKASASCRSAGSLLSASVISALFSSPSTCWVSRGSLWFIRHVLRWQDQILLAGCGALCAATPPRWNGWCPSLPRWRHTKVPRESEAPWLRVDAGAIGSGLRWPRCRRWDRRHPPPRQARCRWAALAASGDADRIKRLRTTRNSQGRGGSPATAGVACCNFKNASCTASSACSTFPQ